MHLLCCFIGGWFYIDDDDEDDETTCGGCHVVGTQGLYVFALVLHMYGTCLEILLGVDRCSECMRIFLLSCCVWSSLGGGVLCAYSYYYVLMFVLL